MQNLGYRVSKTTAPLGPIPPTPYGRGPLPFTATRASMVFDTLYPKFCFLSAKGAAR